MVLHFGRFRITITLAVDTSTTYALMFDSAVRELLQRSCEELVTKEHYNDNTSIPVTLIEGNTRPAKNVCPTPAQRETHKTRLNPMRIIIKSFMQSQKLITTPPPICGHNKNPTQPLTLAPKS